MFVPMYSTVHMYVYFTQMKYTAQLQLTQRTHNLLYDTQCKTDINTRHYAHVQQYTLDYKMECIIDSQVTLYQLMN
jgi:hypothetical protein